ncbi:MAG: flagellar export chaperone FliS [Rhodocyclaceae bacterium]|nr:MAG: flagellar export chaperone FliS [Rhodocyclaceae bacterium]
MFGVMNNPAGAYRKAGVETKVETATPHELVIMLYEGALTAIMAAGVQIQEQKITEKGQSIGRAIDIIDGGLKACLDYQAGGEIAERLGALYEYMCNRLLHANLHNDLAALDEVAKLLRELKGAWEEIAADPAVVSRNKAVA